MDTFPYLEVLISSSQVEHEASTSKIGGDQLFYFRQRGISPEDAITLIVNGFCKQPLRELPMEFAVEAQKLLGGLAARAGGARVTVGAMRVTLWGALAMGLTAGVGALFGTA